MLTHRQDILTFAKLKHKKGVCCIMKALILYFSGTGNTEYTAKLIEQELKKYEIETEIHSIEEKNAIEADSFDYLILGCPKYYEYPVLDFINWLKKNLKSPKHEIPAMMFVTQVGPLATRWNEVKKILLKKGYRLITAKSFPIANNMMIFNAFPETSKEQVQKNIEKLRLEIPTIVNDFVTGKNNIENVGRFAGALTHISAVIFPKIFATFFVRFSPSEKCTGCSLCAKQCPKENIVMKNGRPIFGKKCMFCMRCINTCPVNAILYNKKQCPQMKPPHT